MSRKKEFCSNCGKGCMLCFEAGRSHETRRAERAESRLAEVEAERDLLTGRLTAAAKVVEAAHDAAYLKFGSIPALKKALREYRELSKPT